LVSGIYRYAPTSSLILIASVTFLVLSTLERSSFSDSELEEDAELLETEELEETDEDELEMEDILSLELLSPPEQAARERTQERERIMLKIFLHMSHTSIEYNLYQGSTCKALP